MLFQPKLEIREDGAFFFGKEVSASANEALTSAIAAELWHGFTFRLSHIRITPCDTLSMTVGNAAPLPLCGYDYTIHVTPDGIALLADTRENLIRAYITLLDRIHPVDLCGEGVLRIDAVQIKDKPSVSTRIVHYCIFPDTELWEVQKFIRLAGALKYSHIVLEFWGMFKYSFMKELSWSHAFTKEELAPLIDEAKALGLEVIPMFNHWGHASSCRAMHGKHVVLDQNPALQEYFSEDGWCWDITSKQVRSLLRQVRRELIDLCGEGSYFHIGCDEAYNFEYTKENMDFICDFLNEISAEMKEMGRRAIVWGDMFLFRRSDYQTKNRYTCNAPSLADEEYMLTHLSHDVLIADWQYHAREYPVESAFVFRERGFDSVLCPWDEEQAGLDACNRTVQELGLVGLLHTTWHTLSKGTPYVLLAAIGAFDGKAPWDVASASVKCASLQRKVYFANGDYKRAGWAKHEIGVIC